MADGVTGSSAAQVQSSYEKYKEYFSEEDNSSLDQADFLSLMVEQLKNQDFQNPTDNTEFIAQMAQFTALQSQQQATYYSQAAYASSLVGKTVIVSAYDSKGEYFVDTGEVSSVRLSNDSFEFVVNGIGYESKNIMEVCSPEYSKATVSSTQEIDLTKAPTDSLDLTKLTGTPKVTAEFANGDSEKDIAITYVEGDEDEVVSYDDSGSRIKMTIGLKDIDSITTTSELQIRTNDAITKELENPADEYNPIISEDNFSLSKFKITVDNTDVKYNGSSTLTADITNAINRAAVKTITDSILGTILYQN